MTNRNNQNGSAILLIIVLFFFIAFIAMSTFNSSNFTITKISQRKRNVSAFNIAEAGKEHSVALIKNKNITLIPEETITIFSRESFGGGYYTVTCTANDSCDIVKIQSIGTFNNEKKIVEVTVEIDIREDIPTPVWQKTLYAQGTITIEGNGNLNGGVHCNELFWIKGNVDWDTGEESNLTSCEKIYIEGNAEIDGIVQGPEIIITGSEDIENKIIDTVTTITLPFIDFSNFRDTAIKYGHRYDASDPMWSDDDLYFGSVDGGVVWIDGDVDITKNITYIKGGIICTGSLLIEGNIFHQEQPDDRNVPGFVSTSSTIWIKGNMQYSEGLIYSPGNMLFEGNTGESQVNGQILCGGNLYFKGNYGIFNYLHSDPDNTTETVDTTYSVISWNEL